MLSGGNPTGGANPAGTGSSINYVGNHAYAYSGTFNYNNNFTAGVDFTTGNEYIKARIFWSFSESGSDNVEMQVFTNEEKIFASEALNLVSTEPYAGTYLDIIIPPQTRIKVGCLNATNANSHPANVTLTGRVYN